MRGCPPITRSACATSPGARPQGGQALDELAHLRTAQRAHGDLVQERLRTRNGIATGHEESAPRRGLCDPFQPEAHIGVQIGTAADRQVLLEVVKHQHDRIPGKGFAEQTEPKLVVEVPGNQQSRSAARFRSVGPGERGAHAGGDRPQIEAAGVGGHAPAILRQSLHRSAGKSRSCRRRRGP